MTEATQTRPKPATLPAIELQYQVAMPQPETHLFEVTLRVLGWQADQLDLKMPVWTPGSYLVREYARQLQDFTAESGSPLSGSALPWRKLSKNHWQVETAGAEAITVRYRVYANELTVRTNHLDLTHGYFNGAALFCFIPGLTQLPIQLTIVPPYPDWQVATALPPMGAPAGATAGANQFLAANFDTLVDSPVEVGNHALYKFEAGGKPHRLVIWGEGNWDADRLIADTRKIIEVEAALFGGLPYDEYLFLLHLTAQGFGGLEHKASCSLIYSRFGFREADRYQRFMQLVAHEFFHLWNVKRIRPKGLETFDYEAENYTPSLWFSEGTTSYYDLLLPLRANIYDAKTFLKTLSKEISQFLTTPGRLVQPLAESSFDAWIKLYRRDANSNNTQMSYYLKGEMVSLLLDLLIRDRHQNQRSLDDVLRSLWQEFGQPEIGFTPAQLQSTFEQVAGFDLSDRFNQWLNTTQELPFNEYLQPFGLCLKPEDTSQAAPYLGLVARSENNLDLIKFVAAGSPAQQAGLDTDDQLLAIDGVRVQADQLSDRLKDYQPGETIELTVFHQDQLRTCSVRLAAPLPGSYCLSLVEQPTPEQKQRLEAWLGASWEDMA